MRIVLPMPRNGGSSATPGSAFRGVRGPPRFPSIRLAGRRRLRRSSFGKDVLVAKVAETESSRMVGRVGVPHRPEATHGSILVEAGCRAGGEAWDGS